MVLTSPMVVPMKGGGSTELRGVDFPSVQGFLPIQGRGEEVRRRASVTFFVVDHDIGIQRDLVVILSLFWTGL